MGQAFANLNGLNPTVTAGTDAHNRLGPQDVDPVRRGGTTFTVDGVLAGTFGKDCDVGVNLSDTGVVAVSSGMSARSVASCQSLSCDALHTGFMARVTRVTRPTLAKGRGFAVVKKGWDEATAVLRLPRDALFKMLGKIAGDLPERTRTGLNGKKLETHGQSFNMQIFQQQIFIRWGSDRKDQEMVPVPAKLLPENTTEYSGFRASLCPELPPVYLLCMHPRGASRGFLNGGSKTLRFQRVGTRPVPQGTLWVLSTIWDVFGTLLMHPMMPPAK